MLFDFRSYINVLRAIAIFSVVCAHVSTSGGGIFKYSYWEYGYLWGRVVFVSLWIFLLF